MHEERKRVHFGEWIKAILIAVVLAGVIRQFFFAPIHRRRGIDGAYFT